MRLSRRRNFIHTMLTASRAVSLLLLCAIVYKPAISQIADTEPPVVSEVNLQVRVVDSMTLISGNNKIKLWGVENVESVNALFKLRARAALESKIAGQQIRCHIKTKAGSDLIAQCVNAAEEDLSLFMLQQGYVLANREAVYGSIFEKPYVEGEKFAQSQIKGIWADSENGSYRTSDTGNNSFMIWGSVLVGGSVLALVLITFYIVKTFKSVVEVQNQNLDLVTKERILREKEKFVIATMIDAEVKTNKSKLEAYLMVYEEILRDLQDKTKEPRYKKSGDVVQKQPALSRSVFDGNTDKLDLLGGQLSSDIIHYYARIKTLPDYVDFEPDAPVSEFKKVIETAVSGAKKLNEISDNLLDKFASMMLVQQE